MTLIPLISARLDLLPRGFSTLFWGRTWFYSCATVEGNEKGEIVENANVHMGFVQLGENMLGLRIGRAEFPSIGTHFLFPTSMPARSMRNHCRERDAEAHPGGH
jgi:hypothetical protein